MESLNKLAVSLSIPIIIFVMFLFSIFVLPEFIPAEYQTMAVVLSLTALVIATVSVILALHNFRAYVLLGLILLTFVPFYERYLTVFFGYWRIVPQIWIILLALMGVVLRRIPFRRDPVNMFNIAWFVLNSFVLILSSDISTSLPGFVSGVLGPCVFLHILQNYILTSKPGFNAVLRALIWISFIYIVFSFWVVYSGYDDPSLVRLYSDRFGMSLPGGYYSSNAIGAYTAFTFPLIFWVAINRFNVGKAMQILVFFQLPFTALCLLLSLSRGALLLIVFYTISFGLYVLYKQGRFSRIGLRSSMFFIFFLGAIFFLLSKPGFLTYAKERVFGSSVISMMQFEDHSLRNLRFTLVKGAYEIGSENLLGGVGLGNLRYAMLSQTGYEFDSHNLFMDVFAEQGVFVFLTLLLGILFHVRWVWRAWRSSRNSVRELHVSLFMGTFSFLLYGIVTGAKFVSIGEMVGGLAFYFFTISMALQFYLARHPDLFSENASHTHDNHA